MLEAAARDKRFNQVLEESRDQEAGARRPLHAGHKQGGTPSLILPLIHLSAALCGASICFSKCKRGGAS